MSTYKVNLISKHLEEAAKTLAQIQLLLQSPDTFVPRHNLNYAYEKPKKKKFLARKD